MKQAGKTWMLAFSDKLSTLKLKEYPNYFEIFQHLFGLSLCLVGVCPATLFFLIQRPFSLMRDRDFLVLAKKEFLKIW
jgi:hypothetical protein